MKPKKPVAVDRLPWDRQGLELRFRHYWPTLHPSDRENMVVACLNSQTLFGMTAEELFEKCAIALKSSGARSGRR